MINTPEPVMGFGVFFLAVASFYLYILRRCASIFSTKGLSSVVERWSPKPLTCVRFVQTLSGVLAEWSKAPHC